MNNLSFTHYGIFLSGFGDRHSFQTFSDKGNDRRLVKQFHGQIGRHLGKMISLNQKGAGIFFTVNQTDLLGRSTANITKVRSVFIDLDGEPLPKSFSLDPHFVVETSPKRYHAYWLVKDMPLESFRLYQIALATKYNSDPKVQDLPRVMRLPGFYHKKGKPFPVKILTMIDEHPYTREQIKEGLKLKRPEVRKTVYNDSKVQNGTYTGAIKGAKQGERHGALIKMLIAIRLRGESYEYARREAVEFGNLCEPQVSEQEITFQVNDIWKRYGSATLSN